MAFIAGTGSTVQIVKYNVAGGLGGPTGPTDAAFSVWLKITNQETSKVIIKGYYGKSYVNVSTDSTSGKLLVSVADYASGVISSFTTFDTPTGWFHLLVNQDGDLSTERTKLYVNNAKIATLNLASLYYWNGSEFEIGASTATSTQTVSIYDLAFWSRTLTTNEISDLYNGVTRPDSLSTNCMVYWKLDWKLDTPTNDNVADGDAGLEDQIGSKDLTKTGSPRWDTSFPTFALAMGSLTNTSHGYSGPEFSWTVAVGGTAPYTYQLQRTSRGGSSWSNISGATSSPATDTTAVAGTQYDYRVACTDDVSDTVYSTTTQVDVDAMPAIIVGVTYITAISSTSVTVSCIESTGGVGTLGYQLYRNGLLIDGATSYPYTDGGRSLYTEYTYFWRITDEESQVEDTDPITVKTEDTWTDVDGAIASGLIPGTEYELRVRYTDSAPSTVYSDSVTETTIQSTTRGTISSYSYASIAINYGTAYNAVQYVSEYYYQAAYEIIILTTFDPEIDLLVPFYNAYLTAQAVIAEPPSSVITAINRLQSHVLDKSRYYLSEPSAGETWDDKLTKYTDINDWLGVTIGADLAFRVMDPTTEPPTLDPLSGYSISTYIINQSSEETWEGFRTLSERAGYTLD
jgi:hypothetical protein